MTTSGYQTRRDAARADVGRAIAMTSMGALSFAAVEIALTVALTPGPIRVATALRLGALASTLALWLWFAATLALALVMVVATRLVPSQSAPRGHLGPGWFVPSALRDGVRPGVPRMWTALLTLAAVGGFVQQVAAYAHTHYKEPQLAGVWIAQRAVVACALAWPMFRLLEPAVNAVARALATVLGRANPAGRWRAAGVMLSALIGAALVAIWFALPQSRSQLPVRMVVSATVFGLGMGLGALLHSRPRRRPRTKKAAIAIAAATFAGTVATLLAWGADLETKYIAITGSPAFDALIKVVRHANDLDRDGFGSLLGENDCAPLTRSIHPGATDIPDDGIDQNCDGRDFSLRVTAPPVGTAPPVPAEFRKPWNILLLTIDTVRYDRTTFGGYASGPARRDTTPRLAELVQRSTSFTFCNAPSAGTMASIPAILTSKYFHSGIALDENVPPRTPPKLRPENTTLPEIMQRGGYRTGVIASHEYWNDWGLDQGVDDYDNSIGQKPDPFRVVADKVTDRALAWISRHQGQRWFLWAHYIDPHGRYVAHPEVVDYGTSEPDLYDAELRWTDQQIGRLVDEHKRLPSAPSTVIIITSDHGDSMGEHSVPVGNHGTALYRELLHVPMIFYVPGNPARTIGGATTNLDITPTVAELAGIDVRDLEFEGRSQVPAIFYGMEDRERIVFAETNAPSPLRAAISETWKLIYSLHANLDELYDLKRDPWEHKNLAPSRPPAFATMKSALDGWLERVVYSKSALFNQTRARIDDVLLTEAPHPAVATRGATLDSGKLEILGIGAATEAPPAPGTRADFHVYFSVAERTDRSYRFQLVVWPIDPATWKPADPVPAGAVRSPLRVTAHGMFPPDRWQKGEYVRERFTIAIPSTWSGGMALGLVATDPNGRAAQSAGTRPANDPNLLVLGSLPLGSFPRPGP